MIFDVLQDLRRYWLLLQQFALCFFLRRIKPCFTLHFQQVLCIIGHDAVKLPEFVNSPVLSIMFCYSIDEYELGLIKRL